jgi:predicted lactoylglutathione lyase
VTIRVTDREASERFYDLVLATLDIGGKTEGESFVEWEGFSIASATAEKPVTRGLHIGFGARSREDVDEFWRAGTAAGHRDDGEPGPRPEYGPDYYGGFLLDPDGNSAEAVHHDDIRPPGNIDHLWIRVADVRAARRFYETIAPYAGLRRGSDRPDRAQFRMDGGSFSLVAGAPSENVHLAFSAPDRETVEAFHRAALEAGYRDNGGPGERPVYHPGYYGAFVLDPDGNNVEVVDHGRRAAAA